MQAAARVVASVVPLGTPAPRAGSRTSGTRRECHAVPAILLGMISSTTPSLEGYRIREYKGIVTGEAILGANIFRDFFAGIRDIVGGRSGAYEEELGKARRIALEELEQAAERLGANAVVGIDIDYEVIGQNGSMLMVSASGTAVLTERIG